MIAGSKLKLRVEVDGKLIGETVFDERDSFLSKHFTERPEQVHYFVIDDDEIVDDSQEIHDEIMEEARNFVENNGRYSSYKSTAVSAVAEYIAEQKGVDLCDD